MSTAASQKNSQSNQQRNFANGNNLANQNAELAEAI
jgi:hypothetical protein